MAKWPLALSYWPGVPVVWQTSIVSAFGRCCRIDSNDDNRVRKYCRCCRGWRTCVTCAHCYYCSLYWPDCYHCWSRVVPIVNSGNQCSPTSHSLSQCLREWCPPTRMPNASTRGTCGRRGRRSRSEDQRCCHSWCDSRKGLMSSRSASRRSSGTSAPTRSWNWCSYSMVYSRRRHLWQRQQPLQRQSQSQARHWSVVCFDIVVQSRVESTQSRLVPIAITKHKQWQRGQQSSQRIHKENTVRVK